MRIGLSKTHLLAAVLLLVMLHAFSFGSVMGMETDKQGQMSSCPFTVSSSICTMGFSEHLSLWQRMFTATLDNNVGLLVALGLTVLAVSLVLKSLETDRHKEFIAYKFYKHEHQKSPVFNKLTELFSRGILNPKIYALATI